MGKQQARIIILPQLFHMEIMRIAHDCNGHIGQTKTVQTILQRFDWPGIHKDVERYVSSCHKCQQNKSPKAILSNFLTQIVSGSPNELMQMDHLKLPKNSTGYVGILVMICHFTKYCEARPYVTAYAKETCDMIRDAWVTRHGCPMVIQSDRGPNFIAELTRLVVAKIGTIKVFSLQYHPQCNGLVERMNQTLIGYLQSYVGRYPEYWPKYLDQAVGAYNATVYATTGYTPNMLMMGKEVRLPLSLLYPLVDYTNDSEPEKYARELQERLANINKLATKTTGSKNELRQSSRKT